MSFFKLLTTLVLILTAFTWHYVDTLMDSAKHNSDPSARVLQIEQVTALKFSEFK